MADSKSDAKATDAEEVELFDHTLGRVVGVFASREAGNAAKRSGPSTHDLTVRKVTTDASS